VPPRSEAPGRRRLRAYLRFLSPLSGPHATAILWKGHCGRLGKEPLVESLLPRPRLLLVAFLLVAALLLRVDGITRPSVASRELYGGLLARQYYFGEGKGLSPPKRRVVQELDRVFNPIEPPVLNLASAVGFHLTGGENLWLPRLFSALFWVVGGVFLYLIAVRLTTGAGALIALALYLFWPFGVWISRRGMPDAMMVALLLASALLVIRYWERPSLARLVAAGLVSSFAVVAKPGVALIFLVVLFVAIALWNRAFRATLRNGRLPLFVVLASAVALAYYVYGTYVRDFLAGESESRLEPDLLGTGWFWKGWWSMIQTSLPFPQKQGFLALVPLAASLAGVAVANPRTRAVLIGFWLGYFAFGLTFTYHIATHSYYSLPLIPILALSIGVLAGFVLERLKGAAIARGALVAFVALGVAAAGFKSQILLTSENPRRLVADYRRIGEVTGHTTHALVIDQLLVSPISYWGWIVANYWYEPTPGQDLPASGDPSPGIDPSQYSFLIVMDVSELQTERKLHAFTRDLPVVARTSDYAVFDLRGAAASR
jgi:4-amino-4-deoxy-L-arabinose transferase-like glycosyltransferase